MMMNKCEISKENTNSYEDGGALRRGPWTAEEDNLLIKYITCNGEGHWNSLAKCAGLNRTGKSCRLRWLNYLKPDIKRGNITPHEQILILELHSRWGNRWSKIAQHLPGRTDNEIKNYWRTRVQKQARQLKVDSSSNKFLEAIRNFWMPRLVEKIEQDSSSTSSMEIQKFTAPSPVFTVPSIPSPKPINMVNNNSDSNNSSVKNSSYLIPPVAQACGKIAHEQDGCFYVGVPTYDMQEMESQDIFGFSGCHVVENDWFEEDLGSIFSSINEEIMQLRKLEMTGHV